MLRIVCQQEPSDLARRIGQRCRDGVDAVEPHGTMIVGRAVRRGAMLSRGFMSIHAVKDLLQPRS